MWTWIKRLAVVIVVLAATSGAWAWYSGSNAPAAVGFRTAAVVRGNVVSTIGATGTLEPEEVVDVGSQVTGQIIKFGQDANGRRLDYTSEVKAGDLLALIDDTTYAASVREATAQLNQAKAGVLRAEADLLTAQAKSEQADRDWARAEKIGAGDALAQTTYDTYKSTYEQGRATVAMAQAGLESARASVEQADSAVKRAQRNLDYCTIKAPVDGKIIDRRVNLGQTVVSSMSASSLFLIAKDLHHMQVWVAVNEADIGNIHAGQPVTFTCDAFGDRAFKGNVGKFRLNAQNTQNVVIYTVEVNTENPDLSLLPYLTANVHFEVTRRDDVLTVPNAALRWTPTNEQIAPDVRPADDKAAGPGDKDGGHGPGGGGRTPAAKAGEARDKPGTLWVKDGAFVRPVKVTAGLTDGAVTEVKGDGVDETLQVVTGVTLPGQADAGPANTNPFMPQFRRR